MRPDSEYEALVMELSACEDKRGEEQRGRIAAEQSLAVALSDLRASVQVIEDLRGEVARMRSERDEVATAASKAAALALALHDTARQNYESVESERDAAVKRADLAENKADDNAEGRRMYHALLDRIWQALGSDGKTGVECLSQLIDQRDSLLATQKALVEALEDFRDYGTRHDLTPTKQMPTRNVGFDWAARNEQWWHEWIAGMDSYVRDTARAALAAAEGRGT